MLAIAAERWEAVDEATGNPQTDFELDQVSSYYSLVTTATIATTINTNATELAFAGAAVEGTDLGQPCSTRSSTGCTRQAAAVGIASLRS